MQHCDSTCWSCAAEFFRWWRDRAGHNNRSGGRSGPGAFAAEQGRSRERGVAAVYRSDGGDVEIVVGPVANELLNGVK